MAGMAPTWRFGVLAAAGAVGTSSVVPALPAVAAALGLGEAATAGVVSAYVVPYAAATIVAGQVCDDRGPRGVLRWSVALAVVGALTAAFAPDATVLLGGRFAQGLGAGAATMAAYDVTRRADGGIAATAALLTLGASTGPLLGGLLTSTLGWPAAIALPGVLYATGVAGLGTPTTGDGRSGVDVTGLAVTACGGFALAAGLQLARIAAVPAAVVGLVGVATLALAVRRAVRRGTGSVPPPRILALPALRRRGAVAASIAGTYFAALVVVPVGLGATGWGAVGIGLALVPAAVSGAASARASGRIGALLGARTDPLAAVVTVAVAVTVVLAPPLVGALAIVPLAAAYGAVQPRMLDAVATEVTDGPATAIGAGNLVLLLGGGVGSAAVGGLGRVGGGVALAVLAAAVATWSVAATVREAGPAATRGR